jgi:hypothetical protein
MNAAAAYDPGNADPRYVDEWYIARLTAAQACGVTVIGAANHNGILKITPAASANSGIVMRQGYNSTYLNTQTTNPYDFDFCEFVFRVPVTTNARIRMGWMGSSSLWAGNTVVAGDDGAFIYITGTSLYGKAVVNGSEYTTSLYTITANTWYTGRVRTEDGDRCAFTVDSESGTNLFSQVLWNFPTGPVGMGFVAWVSTSTSYNILDIDYMNYFLAPRSR